MDENPYIAPQNPETQPPSKSADETVWSMFVLAIVIGAAAVVSLLWHDERRRETYVYMAHFATIAAIVMIIRLTRRWFRRATNRTSLAEL